MSDQDFDQNATLFIPTGGRGRNLNEATLQSSTAKLNPEAALDLDTLSGVNQLVAAANPILCSIPPIRGMLRHPDPNGLRETQLQQISNFEKKARRLNISPESILVARYALCTFIDETVAATPWGGTAEMAKNSLLVTLHKEASGGEKFFLLLNRLAEDPAGNIELLEFFYICLALGFEGRFRIIEGGKSQLEGVKERLLEMIRRQRGEYERDLSKQWQGETISGGRDIHLLRLWVSVAAVSFVLLGIYIFCLFRLNAHSDEIDFAGIVSPKPVQKESARAKNISPRLAVFLRDEIASGSVEVREDGLESVVTIQGDGLFDSGSVELRPEYQKIIDRISEAVNQVRGQVVIVGHTDNVPSRSLQYPSNWHLSKGRASSVGRSMLARLAGQRSVIVEGRGDTEPKVANDSPGNRALNRRVEIIVKAS